MRRIAQGALLWAVLALIAATSAICAPQAHFRADSLEYNRNTETFTARGNVEIRYLGIRLTCDFARVHRSKRRIFARGNVIIYRGPIISKSKRAYLNLSSMTALLTQGKVLVKKRISDKQLRRFLKTKDFNELKRTPDNIAILAGRRIRRVDKNTIELSGPGSYTSCICRNRRPDWTITADRAIIRRGDSVTLYKPTFCILGQGIPLLRFPWLRVPIGRRRSGLLLPSIGFDGRDGFNASIAWYQVLSDHADATLGLMVNQDRGVIESLAVRWAIDNSSDGWLAIRHLVDLAEDKTNRFRVRGSTAGTVGPVRGFLKIDLLSDHLFIYDLSPSLLERSTRYTVNNIALASEWRLFSVGIIAEFYQDLQLDPRTRPVEPRNLFKLPHRLTIQRLPALWGWIGHGVGLFRWEFETRYTAFSPLTRAFVDSGNDGISPKDTGYKAPDADNSESNRRLDGSESILQVHRLDLAPTITLPLDLWGVAHLRLFTGARYQLWATQAERGLRRHRFSVNLGADLWTEISRVYNNKFKHLIEPAIHYRLVPLAMTRGDLTRLPNYQPVDFVKRVQRLGVSLRTALIQKSIEGFPKSGAHYKTLFDIQLLQEFDFDIEGSNTRLGHLQIKAELNPPFFSFSSLFVLRWTDPALAEVNVSASFNHPGGHSMLFVLSHLQTDSRSRFFRDPVDELTFRGIQRPTGNLKPLTVAVAGPTVKLFGVLTLFHRIVYSFTDEKLLQTETGLQLTSKCRCWSLTALVRTMFNVTYPSVFVTFSLKGLGS